MTFPGSSSGTPMLKARSRARELSPGPTILFLCLCEAGARLSPARHHTSPDRLSQRDFHLNLRIIAKPRFQPPEFWKRALPC